MTRLILIACIIFLFSCQKESDVKLNSNIDTIYKKLTITAPENGSIIYKDDSSKIEVKWTKQKNAISYEIQADYSVDFINIGKSQLSHKIVVGAQDTVAYIEKLKINWNALMYIRVRTIYADSTSNWSNITSVNISDPRLTDYLGDYLFDISYISYNAGVIDTVTRENVFCTITKVANSSNIFECGLLLIDTSRFAARFNPYYIGIGDYGKYNKYTFYGETTGLPCGEINFITDNNGNITLAGRYSVSFKTGSVNYTLNGKKL